MADFAGAARRHARTSLQPKPSPHGGRCGGGGAGGKVVRTRVVASAPTMPRAAAPAPQQSTAPPLPATGVDVQEKEPEKYEAAPSPPLPPGYVGPVGLYCCRVFSTVQVSCCVCVRDRRLILTQSRVGQRRWMCVPDSTHRRAKAFTVTHDWWEHMCKADFVANNPTTRSKTVVLREGTHYLHQSIELGPRHSDIHFRAHPDEDSPVVSGGTLLKLGKWEPFNTTSGSNIWVRVE